MIQGSGQTTTVWRCPRRMRPSKKPMAQRPSSYCAFSSKKPLFSAKAIHARGIRCRHMCDMFHLYV